MNLKNWALGLFAVSVCVAMIGATGVFPTDSYGKYVGPGVMRTHFATGAAGTAIADTLDVVIGGDDVYYEILSIRVAFSAELAGAATFTATIDSDTDSDHDFVFAKQAMLGYQYFGQTYDPPLVISAGDDIDCALTLDGADSAVTWGLEVIYRDRSE